MKKITVEVNTDMGYQMNFDDKRDVAIRCAGEAYNGTVFFAEDDYYMVISINGEDTPYGEKSPCVSLTTGEVKMFDYDYLIHPLITSLAILGNVSKKDY